MKKTFLILQYSQHLEKVYCTTVVQYQSWHTGTALSEQARVLTGGERGMGDGRAKESSVIGVGWQAAISLTPGFDGTSSGSLLEPDVHLNL